MLIPLLMASNRTSVGRTSSRHKSLAKVPSERNSSRFCRRRHSSKCQHVVCDTSYSSRRNNDSDAANNEYPRRRRYHDSHVSVGGSSAAVCNRPKMNRTRSESPEMVASAASEYTSHRSWRTCSGPLSASSRDRRRRPNG